MSTWENENNQQYHRKEQLDSFHLSGHKWGFHPQIQKLESHRMTQGPIHGVKRIKLIWVRVRSSTQEVGGEGDKRLSRCRKRRLSLDF